MNLVPRFLLGTLDLTDYPYRVEFGLDLGAPQTAQEVVSSLLLDGDLVVSRGKENRTITLSVVIEGTDLDALAEAEQALVLEADKPRNLFTVDPGDGFGTLTIFETFQAQAVLERDDVHEQNNVRRWSLSMLASANGRSAEQVTIPALPVPGAPTFTTVDSCDSTTGWSSPTGVVASSGAVVSSTGGAPISLTRVGSIAMSATPYLVLDWRYSGMAFGKRLTVGGVELQFLAETASPITGYTRSYWLASSSTINDFTFAVGGSPTSVAIAQVSRTNTGPMAGTGRQKFRAFTVPGSARTTGSLHVSHPTSALGDVLVYTCTSDDSGYQPPLRRWRAASAALTDDTSMVSGQRNTITGTEMTFNIPARTLPTGTYDLYARVRASDSGLSRIGRYASALVGTTEKGAQAADVDLYLTAGMWTIVRLATFALPPVYLVGSAGVVRVGMRLSDIHTHNVEVDEAWLFNTSDGFGDLSIVSCGSGTPSIGGPASHAWLKAATVDEPLPRILIGTQEDMTDAYGATDVKFSSQPNLPPGQVNAFVVTTEAVDALTEADLYPRWHTSARQIA